MALTTIAFCHNCKWRSSPQPMQKGIAGLPCPHCGSGVSDIHCDPAFVGTDHFGRPYIEADAIVAHLNQNGISTSDPVNVPLPD